MTRIGDWERTEGGWLHRPWWKCAINTVLRWFQPWPRKWVVFTRTELEGQPPKVLGYGFGRVLHLRFPRNRTTST